MQVSIILTVIILVFALVLVGTFVVLTKSSREILAKKKESKGHGLKESSMGEKSSWRIPWKKVVTALVLVLAVVFVWPYFKDGFSDKTAEVEVIKMAIKIPPEQRRWQLCWEKLPGYPGVDPSKRTGCNPARIVMETPARFDVVATYRHHFEPYQVVLEWNKVASPQYGTWRQPAPEGFGEWKMRKVSDSHYEGWSVHKNKKGRVIDKSNLWLEEVKVK